MEYKKIDDLTHKLERLYPIEGFYGSKSSLYRRALADKVITQEELSNAQVYYGRLWNYAGD